MRKLLALLLIMLLALGMIPTMAFGKEDESLYEQTLFDHSKLIEIDIQMEKDAWDQMIATASQEEYSACNVVVNGVLYENVAIRPKGNSSMSTVTSRGSERYSWRIKFDKYEKKQTCDGLDVLILNNGFHDAGGLREAISYDMYRFLDADASLYNYAVVSLNGEYFGVYLALECVDKSFVKRNYGDDYGELYKPDIADRGAAKDDREDRGDSEGESGDSEARENGNEAAEPAGSERTANENGETPEAADRTGESNGESGGGERPTRAEGEDGGSEGESETGESSDAPAAGERAEGESNGERAEGESDGDSAGGMGNNQLAMSLNYIDDNLESYQGIWDSTKFNSDDEDHARVVEALKHVCQGDNIGDYLDVDNVLKYFAIQTYIYNHDGLTGNVAHNYYLYEEDGKLNLIPWDMNESFTVSGTGNDYVNFPIDTPFAINDLSQRSFFMALLENEEYLEIYHEYLRKLSEEYALGGEVEETFKWIRSMIDELVKTDPTAFSTYDEYAAAAESLELVVKLRAEGVLGQLSGEIPSTKEGQSAEPDKLLDVSGEDLSGLTDGDSGGGMGGWR